MGGRAVWSSVAGVVHPNIEAPEGLGGVGSQRLHLRQVGDIARHSGRRAPCGTQFADGALDGFCRTRRDHHLRALVGASAGDSKTQAARAAGDDNHFVL